MHSPNHDRSDYFPIGDGALACIVEWNHVPDREAYGLLLAQPGRMARREGTLLWHPEHGLSRTMLTVIIDGTRHKPLHASTTVEWDDPSIVIRWQAGDAIIEERLYSIAQVLRREVLVRAGSASDIQVEAALYGNPVLFDEFTAEGHHLEARGLTSLALYGGEPFERFTTASAVPIEHGVFACRFEYVSPSGLDALGAIRDRHASQRTPTAAATDGRKGDTEYTHDAPPDFTTGTSPKAAADSRLGMASSVASVTQASRQLAIACRSMRAVVSRDGRFNASLFQYEFEWGLDAAMVASAAAVAGDHLLAGEILTNILTRLSNDDGMIGEAGRFRGGELSELNGNGAVLDAVCKHWRFSRDERIVREHWDRIVAIAEYPLREEFAHESGLLRTRRDFWERYPWQGVGDGFELGHQVFCCVGLESASMLARHVGDEEHAQRWHAASSRIRTAMLEHPTHSLIDDCRFIRRRLINGDVETSLVADPTWRRPEFSPYLPDSFDTLPRACEPDVTEVLPIIHGLVDPLSDVARRTLEAIGELWTPVGGYSRYNIASEPDSPGPWPFATAMVAAAELEAGLDDRARRALDWLLKAALPGGAWLEYHGERRLPPLPPVGIIVWGWAQFVLLAIETMAGVRIENDRVHIRPRMAGIAHTLRIGEHTLRIDVRGLDEATLDGEPCELDLSLLLPLTAHRDVVYR